MTKWMRYGFLQAPVFADAADDNGAAGGAGKDGAANGDDAAAKAAADQAAADQAAADKKASDDAAAAAAANTDGKPGDQATTGKAGDAEAKPKAPSEYTLTLPENGPLKERDLPRIRAVAEINGWDEATTQAEINRAAALAKVASEEFLGQARVDPEIGGAQLERTEALAHAVLRRVRPEGHARHQAFMELMQGSGYINHPEVLSFLKDIGLAMGEDQGLQVGASSGTANAGKSPAEILFGKD